MDCSPPVPLSMGVSRQQYWSVSQCFLLGHISFSRCDPVWMENKSTGVVTFSWGEQCMVGIWSSHWVSLQMCGWLNHRPQDWTQTWGFSSIRRGWQFQLVSHGSRRQSSNPEVGCFQQDQPPSWSSPYSSTMSDLTSIHYQSPPWITKTPLSLRKLQGFRYSLPESSCLQGGRPGFDPWEDPLEKEMATHSSILAWKTVHGAAKSWRRLGDFTSLPREQEQNLSILYYSTIIVARKIYHPLVNQTA